MRAIWQGCPGSADVLRPRRQAVQVVADRVSHCCQHVVCCCHAWYLTDWHTQRTSCQSVRRKDMAAAEVRHAASDAQSSLAAKPAAWWGAQKLTVICSGTGCCAARCLQTHWFTCCRGQHAQARTSGPQARTSGPGSWCWRLAPSSRRQRLACWQLWAPLACR